MDDKYDFIRVIGKSITGGVYETVCKSTGKPCTIRRLEPCQSPWQECWQQPFLKKIPHLVSINNPNVVNVTHASLDTDGAYIVYDYFPSVSLTSIAGGNQSLDLIDTFILHGMSALSALHNKGLIHGHMTTESFIYSHLPCGNKKFVMKDFGLRDIAPMIHGLEPANFLASDTSIMAPEHFRKEPYTAQTDIYMFGQLCYYFIVGSHPLGNMDIGNAYHMHMSQDYKGIKYYKPSTPDYITKWIEAMTQPNLEDRPKNIESALRLFNLLSEKRYTLHDSDIYLATSTKY